MMYMSEKGIDEREFTQEDWKEYEKDYSDEDTAPESEELGPDTKRDLVEQSPDSGPDGTPSDRGEDRFDWIDDLNTELDDNFDVDRVDNRLNPSY